MPTYKQTGVNYKLKLIVNAFACITIIVWFGSGFLRTKKDQPYTVQARDF